MARWIFEHLVVNGSNAELPVRVCQLECTPGLHRVGTWKVITCSVVFGKFAVDKSHPHNKQLLYTKFMSQHGSMGIYCTSCPMVKQNDHPQLGPVPVARTWRRVILFYGWIRRFHASLPMQIFVSARNLDEN